MTKGTERKGWRIIKSHSTRILGHEVVKKSEEIEYVSEDPGMREKIKIVTEASPAIPKKLRSRAITLVSQLYGDTDSLWNPEVTGEMGQNAQMVVFNAQDEVPNKIGIELAEKGIKPGTLLQLANDSFCTMEGRYNENLQGFLLHRIKYRMGIREDEEGF